MRYITQIAVVYPIVGVFIACNVKNIGESMFDESKSGAFQELANLSPNLKCEKDCISVGEITCSGSCKIKGKCIPFEARAAAEDMEETLLLLLQVFISPDKYIERARDYISKNFFPIYLENKDDDDPEITEEEFKDKLTLASLGVYYNKVVSIGFNEDWMLGGHELVANSLDKGKMFTETEEI